jgi:hypothetical protein
LVKGGERASPPPGGGGQKKKKQRDIELIDIENFNKGKLVWPRDDPFEEVNGLEFMFSCSRGNETYILGDTIEIYEYVLFVDIFFLFSFRSSFR